jgi:crossover junction endodeoxyribonuclease RusA
MSQQKKKSSVYLTVPGRPAPQGSKSAFIVNGRVNLVEQSKRLPAYRKAIAAECVKQSFNWIRYDHAPIAVSINFAFKPPKRHGEYPVSPPDLDKLCRSVLDGITQSGVIWRDDSQVVVLKATKTYSEQERTEIEVKLWEHQ